MTEKPSLAKKIMVYGMLILAGYSAGYHSAERKFGEDYAMCQRIVDDARRMHEKLEEKLERIEKSRSKKQGIVESIHNLATSLYRGF